MADRLDATFADFRAQERVREEQWAYRASPDYRETIRREVLADPAIDWDRMRALFGGEGHEVAAE